MEKALEHIDKAPKTAFARPYVSDIKSSIYTRIGLLLAVMIVISIFSVVYDVARMSKGTLKADQSWAYYYRGSFVMAFNQTHVGKPQLGYFHLSTPDAASITSETLANISTSFIHTVVSSDSIVSRSYFYPNLTYLQIVELFLLPVFYGFFLYFLYMIGNIIRKKWFYILAPSANCCDEMMIYANLLCPLGINASIELEYGDSRICIHETVEDEINALKRTTVPHDRSWGPPVPIEKICLEEFAIARASLAVTRSCPIITFALLFQYFCIALASAACMVPVLFSLSGCKILGQFATYLAQHRYLFSQLCECFVFLCFFQGGVSIVDSAYLDRQSRNARQKFTVSQKAVVPGIVVLILTRVVNSIHWYSDFFDTEFFSNIHFYIDTILMMVVFPLFICIYSNQLGKAVFDNSASPLVHSTIEDLSSSTDLIQVEYIHHDSQVSSKSSRSSVSSSVFSSPQFPDDERADDEVDALHLGFPLDEQNPALELKIPELPHVSSNVSALDDMSQQVIQAYMGMDFVTLQNTSIAEPEFFDGCSLTTDVFQRPSRWMFLKNIFWCTMAVIGICVTVAVAFEVAVPYYLCRYPTSSIRTFGLLFSETSFIDNPMFSLYCDSTAHLLYLHIFPRFMFCLGMVLVVFCVARVRLFRFDGMMVATLTLTFCVYSLSNVYIADSFSNPFIHYLINDAINVPLNLLFLTLIRRFKPVVLRPALAAELVFHCTYISYLLCRPCFNFVQTTLEYSHDYSTIFWHDLKFSTILIVLELILVFIQFYIYDKFIIPENDPYSLVLLHREFRPQFAILVPVIPLFLGLIHSIRPTSGAF